MYLDLGVAFQAQHSTTLVPSPSQRAAQDLIDSVFSWILAGNL